MTDFERTSYLNEINFLQKENDFYKNEYKKLLKMYLKLRNNSDEHRISILGTDKKQYTLSEFIAQNKDYHSALGIIIQTQKLSFIMALEVWYEKWGTKNILITETQNILQAVQYTSGLELTRRIVEAQENFDCITAAKRCWTYNAGQLQWYLPCLMELSLIYINRIEINNILKNINCPEEWFLMYDDEYVCSCNECDENFVWFVDMEYGNFSNATKYECNVVRAVTPYRLFRI